MSFQNMDIEYPDSKVIEEVREFFANLIDIGADVWGVEYGGYKFYFAMLQEWEEREIYRRLSGLDTEAKIKLIQLETLVRGIIKVVTPSNQTVPYLSTSEKEQLRSILLALKPPVIEYLYRAYLWGANKVRARIEELYGKLEEVEKRGFFESSGS